MILIGLTGGIGMGKTTVAGCWARRRVPVADTDAIARELVAPGNPALSEVVRVFGSDMLTGTGELDRARLASEVFTHPDKRRQLEAILHPRIREAWQKRVGVWRETGERLGVVVIPLLYETQAEGEFDRVVCAACQAATQRTRLRARGWGDAEIERRNAAQLPIEEKMARADHVIWTEGRLAATEAQAEILLTGWLPSA